MHPTDSGPSQEPPILPQAWAREPIAEHQRSSHVPRAAAPATRRRFCAAMYDYCLTPQYWEAF